MEVHSRTIQQPSGAKEVITSAIVLSLNEAELRNQAICAIMEMDIQDVVKYLSYIKDGKI